MLTWLVRAGLVLAVSIVLQAAAGALYYEAPIHHKGPITAQMQNSFPSQHALLAMIVTVLVLFARPRWAPPFAVAAIAIEVALVLRGDHYVIDVVASTLIVGVSALIALLGTRVAMRGSATVLAAVLDLRGRSWWRFWRT